MTDRMRAPKSALLFTLFTAALGAVPCRSEAGEVPPLTWEEAVAEAGAHNPALLAARETVAKSEAALKASYASFLPSLSADGSYSKSDTETAPQSNSYSMGLSARQNLFSGFKDSATVDKRKAELEASRSQLRSALAQTSYDLRRAFSEILYAQERTVLTRAIAARRRENMRLLDLRFQAGKEHKGSFLRIQAAYRSAEFDASRADRALRVARRSLASALGREGLSVIAATGTFSVSAQETAPDFEALALNTPEYRRAESSVDSAKAGVTIARGDFIPEVSASASGSRSADRWPVDRDRWSTGVSVSLPLFSGGQDYQGVKSAAAEKRRAESALTDARHAAALKLQDAFFAMQDASERTEVQRQFLDAAEVRSQIARGQYTSGLLNFDDWDIIENDLIDKQQTMLSSLRDAYNAAAGWEFAKGEGAIR